ncbi:MAG: hypothetical protein LBL66_00355, partial [Clostridiales bacterium]|nr:hypothetical protein [Clostridiales bacterium]
MKKNLIVFYGGKTCEHEISVITAQQTIAAVSREKYEIFPVRVGPDGVWRHGRGMDRPVLFAGGGAAGAEVFLTPGSVMLYRRRKRRGIKAVAEIHAALLCMHGLNGEDGTLQGLLELSGVPYTS